jgi:hypothetical protein
MLNKKVLLAALLLASPSFALLSSKEAKSVADDFNGKFVKEQLPTLLEEIDKEINLACEKGEYNTSVEILKYSVFTIKKAEDILSREGYQVNQLPGYPGSSFLYIEW